MRSMELGGVGRSVFVRGGARRTRWTTIMVHGRVAMRTIVIPVSVPIPVTVAISPCSPTRLEVNRLTANRTLGTILASAAATAARRIAVPLVVIVVGMPQQIGITSIRTGVQVHLGQWHLDQLAVALPVTRGIQPIVEAFAHETPLPTTLPHALLHPLAGYGAAHEVWCYPFSGQDSSETG